MCCSLVGIFSLYLESSKFDVFARIIGAGSEHILVFGGRWDTSHISRICNGSSEF